MNWSESPTVSIMNANLGNRLYQFFAARTLIARYGHGTVSNADFLEWDIVLPREDPRRYRRVIWIKQTEDFDIEYLLDEIKKDPSVYIANKSVLQNQNLYLSKDHYNAEFPINSKDIRVCGASEILINIRTGDILSGEPHWYPLLPVAFYQDIIASTGLKPVFIGQLQISHYVARLRAAFPDAEFIDSQGPIRDFDTIRSARNIIPAVSTFSVAAAWMSGATTVYMPLNGFLNPAHMRDIDLLPVEDPRYRFYMFPMNYALPEEEALLHHAKIAGTWREISREKLRFIQANAPLLGSTFHSTRSADNVGFNERSYVHEYVDVALDISNGWYESGWHHYLDIGRIRGYNSGITPPKQSAYPNLALHCQAWQSSVSAWSIGRSIQQDAIRAVNGDRNKSDGFHTDFDESPWWMVDCEVQFLLEEVHVYNRKGERQLQERATPLLVEISLNNEDWTVWAQTIESEVFGVEPDTMVPLILKTQSKAIARFLRISIPGKRGYLHLAEVEVYGIPL